MEKILSLEEFIENEKNKLIENAKMQLANQYASKPITKITKKGKRVTQGRSKAEKKKARKEFLENEMWKDSIGEVLAQNNKYQKYVNGDMQYITPLYLAYKEKTERKNKMEMLRSEAAEIVKTDEFAKKIKESCQKDIEKIREGVLNHLKNDRLSFDDCNVNDDFYECDCYDDDDDCFGYFDDDDYSCDYADSDICTNEDAFDAYCDAVYECEYIDYALNVTGRTEDIGNIVFSVLNNLNIPAVDSLLENDTGNAAYGILEKSAIDIIDNELVDAVSPIIDNIEKYIKENKYYLEQKKREKEEMLRQEALRNAVLTAIPEKIKDAYPLARQAKRKFVLHIGPTNSGKTFDALQAFRNAYEAAYLAPLRLLALEVAENTNELGVPCSMLTGEEESFVEDATHISETIEMADLTRHYDVAVIDEAQMISDPDRGGAWTSAILGLWADEIHICMAPHAEMIVRELIEYCGDEIKEVCRTERKTPLKPDYSKFAFPKNVKDGDALIVFSKRSVIACAAELQNKGVPCSVIYGALPYETRKAETERFIKGETKVVVATDAIGMGLNLPVKRVVFLETEKFDGQERRRLKAEEVQQIAGRAGRHGLYDEGFYAAKNGMPYITKCMEENVEQISYARLRFPEFLTSVDGSLSEIMQKWNDIPTECLFTKTDISQQLTLCMHLEKYNVSKSVIYRLINIPFNAKDEIMMTMWKKYAKEVVDNGCIKLDDSVFNVNMQADAPTNNESIQILESMYQRYDLIYNFVRLFGDKTTKEKDKENLRIIKRKISDKMTALLAKNVLSRRQCPDCGIYLGYDYPYNVCQDCYENRKMMRRRFYW